MPRDMKLALAILQYTFVCEKCPLSVASSVAMCEAQLTHKSPSNQVAFLLVIMAISREQHEHEFSHHVKLSKAQIHIEISIADQQ